ncbi:MULTISPECIES: ABC transporter permease subunit [unclassified Streptomyces]|uniref:ABC transporter permease subunit n=1 Tax=unclassified Streptomyces TaxID=2593676 RepID=UPI00036BC068|nr:MULTISPECIES: ABC transporter permease subunit [unclassified Streptomyces]MYX34321.1 ABC transporter permease subunit [Streptomyces sp. SID8377]
MTAPVHSPAPQFSSAFPVHRTHLGHALKSEWTKIRTVRSTIWTLGVMLVLILGINLLIVGLDSSEIVSDPVLGFGLFGVLLGQLCVMTLGVLVISSEYGTGMIRTTLTACPQRGRVLAAKAIVFFALTFSVTTAACALTALMNYAAFGGKPVGEGSFLGPRLVVEDGLTTASGTQWLGATVGVGLYVALLGLLSLAVGALLRHSAGAITTMMGVVLLPLIVAIFMQSDSLHTVQEKLIEYSSPNAIASLYQMPMLENGDADGVRQLVVLAIITAVALGAACATLSKRDV